MELDIIDGSSSSSPMSTALVWLRRDLRLADNPALDAAVRHHERVLAVFIWAPEEDGAWPPGAASRWWLHHGLRALSQSLEDLGAALWLGRGDSLEQLQRLAQDTGAEAVYWNRLYDPATIARDRIIKEQLHAQGLAAESFNAALLLEPWQLATGGGTPYKVFTPFWRKLQTELGSIAMPLKAPDSIRSPENAPPSLSLDDLGLLPTSDWTAGMEAAWQPGEHGAHHRLDLFLEQAVDGYRKRRDFPAEQATSRLSPHLHWGEISPHQILHALRRNDAAEPAAGLQNHSEWFLREVAWREFAHHLLFHFPDTPSQPMNDRFQAFPWRDRKDYGNDLRAWQTGQTGIPIVDAGMRELWHTGWMHNRVRMIVGSLLTKNLLIPWQEGARWFWDTLVDASLANNSLGWQWIAGCGADASPYFRIFNPVSQSRKFDVDGDYLRHWVPELKGLGGDALHAPWTAQTMPGGYPRPVVDLKVSRQRALDAYAVTKSA